MEELILEILKCFSLILNAMVVLRDLLLDVVNERVSSLASVVQKYVQVHEISRDILAFRDFLLVLDHFEIDRGQRRIHFVGALDRLCERAR